MKHPMQTNLLLTLVASVLPGAYLIPAFAQPPQVETRKVGTRVRAEMALPPAQIEFVDADARTVSLRTLKLAPDTAPLETPDGGVQIKMVAGDLEIVPLAAQATVVKMETGLLSDVLKIGDIVSLLGQKTAPGQVKIQVGNAQPNNMQREALRPQLPEVLENLGSARFGSKAEYFRVIALDPLTLRKGGEPLAGDEESILSVPFTNGPEALPIGTVSLGTSKGNIMLKLGRGNVRPLADVGPVNQDLRRYVPTGDMDVPVITENYAVTLKMTKVEGLEFDRFTALKLSDVAADLAGGKIRINPEFSQLPGGKREITRLVISQIK